MPISRHLLAEIVDRSLSCFIKSEVSTGVMNKATNNEELSTTIKVMAGTS